MVRDARKGALLTMRVERADGKTHPEEAQSAVSKDVLRTLTHSHDFRILAA